jgi:flagellar M-ring protein FliF
MDAARVLAAWRGLPARVRALIGAGAAVVLVAAVLFAALARDDRVPLFSAALYPDQLGEVETRLAAWNVAFAPSADNVRVEHGRRSDLLLRLSLSGVPHPHVASSAELLAGAGALTPQAVLDTQTRDGLAGDLELALRGIAGIGDARVIVAPGRAGLYADEGTRDASASVRLTLLAGAHLSSGAVAGIRAFVAAAVPGLDAAHVTIVDDSGVALSSEDGDGSREAEALQSTLASALDAAFGAGSSIVRVHVDLDPRAREIEEVRRAPLGGSLARESSDERYAGEKSRYSKSSASEDHGSDVHAERTQIESGSTERISVAVFVRADRAGDLAQIRALAAATAGLRPSRGDTISVEAVQFARADAPAATVWPALAGVIATVVPSCAFAAIAIVVVRYAREPLGRLVARLIERSAVRTTAESVSGYAPSHVRGVLADEPPHTAAAIISALPAATAAAVLELYPPSERADIIRRLSQPVSPLMPDHQLWLGARRDRRV